MFFHGQTLAFTVHLLPLGTANLFLSSDGHLSALSALSLIHPTAHSVQDTANLLPQSYASVLVENIDQEYSLRKFSCSFAAGHNADIMEPIQTDTSVVHEH